jgi:spermidine/putrescine ABC transporter ATP-binding subunit
MTVVETTKGGPSIGPARDRAVGAARSDPTSVALNDITVRYGRNTVLDGLDLEVPRGEFLALLGPSGSGKTTVLRTIAGFIRPAAGAVVLSGVDVTDRPPNKRGIGVVFQSYALFPHMSVHDNIAYPLKARGMKRSAITLRCEELLELVRLPGLGAVRPSRLSGGQQQRVALARALAMEPELLLLDEPLSNLDANLRVDVGAEIRRLQQQTGTTAIMVTHDRREAFSMADRIAVLRGGRIEQLGSPADLYRQPNSRFMAEFVGEANFLPGTVIDRIAEQAVIDTAIGRLEVVTTAAPGAEVDVLVRPEDIRLIDAETPDAAVAVEARVVRAAYFGSSVAVNVAVGGVELSVVASGSVHNVPAAGSTVRIAVRADECVVMPAGGSS